MSDEATREPATLPTTVLGNDDSQEARGSLGRFDPEKARQEDREAFNRLRQYIDEHRATDLLALKTAIALYELYRRG